MDPYFRPIIVSALVAVLLNFIPLPIPGYPMFTYLAGGILAVILFKTEKMKDNSNSEVSVLDVSVLGISTGIVIGSIITLVTAIKLQNPEAQQVIIDEINNAMKMKSQKGFDFLNDLGPSFYFILGLVSIILTTTISFFGSLISLVFVNKAKK